jgi:hypothetical protein
MNKEQAALELIKIIAETIRELGKVVNGHLYAHVMGHIDYDSYMQIIATLKNAGVIKEENFIIEWIAE